MKPIKQTKQQLLDLLTAIRAVIEQNDSFEGCLEYSVTDEVGTYEVIACYRVGNSMGQGGTVLIGQDKQQN